MAEKSTPPPSKYHFHFKTPINYIVAGEEVSMPRAQVGSQWALW